MTIEKVVNTVVKDSKGVEIKPGDVILFHAQGRDVVGRFEEVTNRNMMAFTGPLSKKSFHCKPSCVSDAIHIKFTAQKGEDD